MNKLRAYWCLMRFDRPIGTLLLLWPTLWALWLASRGCPSIPILVVFVLGVLIMRAAGGVINDIWDRNFDGHVERTKQRPLVTKALSVKEALILFIVLCLIAFALVLTLNRLTVFLSLIAVCIAASYPLFKRFFAIPQFVLGVAFAWGIPMAFAAVTNGIPWTAWLLFAATFCWIVAYDTAYAMSDREDDLKIGIKSSAIFFDRFDRLWIGVFQIIMLLMLALLGHFVAINDIFFVTLVIAGGFFIYQHCLLIHKEPKKCLQVFLNNNWVGFVIFFGLIASFF